MTLQTFLRRRRDVGVDTRAAAFEDLAAATGEIRTSGAPSPVDADARLEAILDDYGVLLRRAIARCCPRGLGLDVSAIEQDARLRLWHALRRESRIANPASYLYSIASSVTIDAIRRVKARREEPLESAEAQAAPAAYDQPSPEDAAGQRQAAARVREALHRLSGNRRRAVGLHLQGLTSEEIGRATGWTEAKARNLASRGMKDLRNELRAMGFDVEAD